MIGLSVGLSVGASVCHKRHVPAPLDALDYYSLWCDSSIGKFSKRNASAIWYSIFKARTSVDVDNGTEVDFCVLKIGLMTRKPRT